MAYRRGRKVCRVAVLIGGIVFLAALAVSPFFSLPAEADVQPTARTPAPKPNYRDFPHSAKAHQIECSTCHKFPSANWNKIRPEGEAFADITDYPKHESCVNCHKAQFFKGRPPAICSICHTRPGPRDSSRHPFPNPRELFDKSPKGQKAPPSDFQIGFPHDKHIEIVSMHGGDRGVFRTAAYRAAAEESCAVCHKTYQPQGDSKDEYFTPAPADLGDKFWLKKGTFKTTPIGHTVCFTCHSADSGMEPAPTNCGMCHKLRQPWPPPDFDAKLAAQMKVTDRIVLTQWRNRISAGAFRHEFEMHSSMECATCHTVATMNTLDAKTRKVPISACATCHATPSVDDGGALNFEFDKRQKDPKFQCVKCHVAYGKLPVPASHTQALDAAK